MRAAYVKEQERYSLGDLSSLFSCSREQAAVTIRRLKQFGIVKTVPSSPVQKSMSELLDEDEVIADVDPDHYYVFTFVGLVVVGELVLKCYPKYLTASTALPLRLAQVLHVLERYMREGQIVPIFNDSETGKHFNSLGVMLFLLRDYYEHGVYTQTKDTLETNGPGDINWDRTINETFAFLDHGRPVYMDLKTRRRVNDEMDFFRRLHQSCLAQISGELKDADLLTLLEVPDEELSDEPVDSLGDKDYLLYRIEGEISQQFNTRKQAVLKALHAYLSEGTALGEAGGFSAFGSNSFNLVWESVCSAVLGNQLKAQMSSLPLPLASKYDPNSALISVIDKPQWIGYDDTGTFGKSAGKTLEPDIVKVHAPGGRRELVILDAKYYRINLARNQDLSGQPGIGDLTKQYLYQLAFREFAAEHGIESIKNCFLMPSDRSSIEAIGHASLGMLDGLDLENIQLRLLPASKMFDHYLHGETMDVSALRL